MKKIGHTIKTIRKSKQITQEQLVSHSGVSRSLLSKIEADQVRTSIDNFLRLLEGLNMNFEEFTFIKNNYSLSKKRELSQNFYATLSNADIDSLNYQKKKLNN